MRFRVLLCMFLLVIPLVYSQDCNARCLNLSYASGICTDSCPQVKIEGGDDCALTGQAVLIIGSDAINTYKNLDPFIDEDKTSPKWIWMIKNIKTKAATNIRNTSDETTHTGPLIGIKNNFVATDTDSVDVKAITSGGSFCFPGDTICIKLVSLTVSNYGSYTIKKSTVDLSSVNSSNSSWNNKAAILVYSASDAEGLKLDTTDYDSVVSGANGAKTDNIWIVYNNTGSDAAVFYEDSSNAKKLAGYINMDSTGKDANIADINYMKTQDSDVQIDLRGDFGATDGLDVVLDILGTEGAASIDGKDDTRINLKHSINNDFLGFGNNSGVADDADLVWNSTNIGTKDTDLRSLYGIVIKNPKTNNAADTVTLEIPEDQAKASVEITRTKSSSAQEEKKETSIGIGEKIPEPILASELKIKEDYNLIIVGGPCANPLVETFSDFPTCKKWPLAPGEAMIKYAKNGQNIALLVAGTTAEDTRTASEFLKSYRQRSLKGSYLKIANNQSEVLDPIRGIQLPESGVGRVDLSDYPYPFIKDGTFQNMLLVVGDNAKGKDTIGAVDIAIGLTAITKTTASSNATGDTETEETVTKKIPLGNKLADTPFFGSEIKKSTVHTLLDSTVDYSGKDYHYHESLVLYKNGPSIETSLSSSDDTYKSDVYMEAIGGSLRYYYVFDNEIDISTTSVNIPLTINLLDNAISITDTETATEFKTQSASRYFLKTGQKATVDGIEVVLEDIGKDSSVRVKVNNNLTEFIDSGKNKFVSGIYIRNLEATDETNVGCCCTDLLDF